MPDKLEEVDIVGGLAQFSMELIARRRITVGGAQIEHR
jgi:hypothetical protein